jgi:membrane peptidoglycan carboxypeptidase
MGAIVKGTPNAAATTSVTIPTHAVGDLIVIWAYRDGATTAITKPTASGTIPAWVDIDAPLAASMANNNTCRSAWFVATATNHTSGVWTGATNVVAVVISGQASSPVGGHSVAAGSDVANGVVPALTQSVTDGSSLLLNFCGHRATFTSWSAAPAGYTRQVTQGIVILNTKDSTTSDGSMTNAISTAVGAGYAGNQIEILAVPSAGKFFAMF